MTRPGPLWWLWYAIGGSLPARYSSWVLHDTTTSTWIVRHIVRSLLLLAVPVLLVIVWLPASTGVKLLIALTAGACGLMFQLVHTIETTERRAIRAGYPPGTAEVTRHQRAVNAQRVANDRRRTRNATRRSR
ncbi:MAG: hypothetical protein QOH89_3248 [Pseudonocardiales bacterium]|nr:hypothetical protein [Pseudonocardiales bacterium]